MNMNERFEYRRFSQAILDNLTGFIYNGDEEVCKLLNQIDKRGNHNAELLLDDYRKLGDQYCKCNELLDDLISRIESTARNIIKDEWSEDFHCYVFMEDYHLEVTVFGEDAGDDFDYKRFEQFIIRRLEEELGMECYCYTTWHNYDNGCDNWEWRLM